MRSVSKQGHLQPHCHSKAKALSKQLYNGLFSHSEVLLPNIQFCNSSFPQNLRSFWRNHIVVSTKFLDNNEQNSTKLVYITFAEHCVYKPLCYPSQYKGCRVKHPKRLEKFNYTNRVVDL